MVDGGQVKPARAGCPAWTSQAAALFLSIPKKKTSHDIYAAAIQ